MIRLLSLPVIVPMIILLATAMAATGIVAMALGDFSAAAVFFLYAALVASIAIMAAIAVWGHRMRIVADRHIAGLLAIYLIVPLFAGLPFAALVPDLALSKAYFEMMSAFTTTGTTLFSDPSTISDTAHLWRAVMGWLGGLVILVAAFALLAPLRIGGFEMHDMALDNGHNERGKARGDPAERLYRTLQTVVPIYFFLTCLLSVLLIVAGDRALVAVCHAMSVLATSGISPVGGVEFAGSGTLGEMAIIFFMALALTNRFYGGASVFGKGNLAADPEVRTGLILVLFFALALFLRHYVQLSDEPESVGTFAAFHAAWGFLFTCLSFLTTTGFASASWEVAQAWSEVPAIGLVLLCLVLAGGGIATTAGGIKLLRIFALYKHSIRETERLVHPSSVGGYGVNARRIRREGALVAWVFVMLFLLMFGSTFILLAATGADFVSSLVHAMAALANAGPLTLMFGQDVIGVAELSPEARGILCAAMLIGRVEVLAVVAVLNPEYWRG